MRVEVKTIRNGTKPRVELQKTRAAIGDPSSRYYDRDHFDIVAVCLGRSTGEWSQFVYALMRDLPGHKTHPSKVQVMNTINSDPPGSVIWYERLQDVIDAYEN